VNAKIPVLLACLVAGGTFACTPQAPYPTDADIPPPEVSIELPLEEAPRSAICRLGSSHSCLEADPRPFEPCLATSKECERDGAGAMKIAPPVLPDQPL
jgi:hypothetical protein